MAAAIEITIRDRDLCKEIVAFGAGVLLVKDSIFTDYYVSDVDVYQEELIIYLKEKYNANSTEFSHVTGPSGVRSIQLPRNTK